MNDAATSTPRSLGPRRPHPIKWLRAHPFAADAILAAAMTTISLLVHLFSDNAADVAGTTVSDPTWWSPILLLGAVVPIAWRRRHPLVVGLTVTFAQVVFEMLDFVGTGFIGVLIAVYSVGAHSVGRDRTRALAVIGSLILLLFVLGVVVDELGIADFIANSVVFVTAFVLGDNLRRRRDAAVAMQERAERAERERELVAEQQVAAERNRIARELHDVVAHSVSVMVIQAAAARRSLASSPENAEQALTNIEETGRQTMNELRGILGVLRRAQPATDAGPAERDPQPTLAELSNLFDIADDLPVSLSVDGDVADLPASVTLTGYRVVQEALTNIRRHAGPVTGVDVMIERTHDTVSITVADDGRGAAADDTGPGYGIVGMRERVAAVGGAVEAGWQAGGGWRVTATLPTSSIGPRRPPDPDPVDRPDTGSPSASITDVSTAASTEVTA